VKFFEAIILIRLLKLLGMLYEIKGMRIIIETTKNLVVPLGNFLIIMLTIFYTFALIGSALFGGHIKRDSVPVIVDPGVADMYTLINFNDIAMSYVAMFSLIIVNNWLDCVAMCCAIMGSNNYRFFFIVFYYFGVIIGLNIVIAFAIDMYGSVERLD